MDQKPNQDQQNQQPLADLPQDNHLTIDQTSSTTDKPAEGFLANLHFWPAIIIGFLITLTNLFYGAGFVIFIILLIALSNKKNQAGTRGLVIGYLSIFVILILACGTCFLGGAFF